MCGLWNDDAYVGRVERDGNSAVLDSELVQQMIGAGEFVEITPAAAKPGPHRPFFN
jgi:hypothetical protein